MLSSAKIKFIRSLEHKKNRKDSKIFVAEGVKIVGEALLSGYNVSEIFMTEDSPVEIPTNIDTHIISHKNLERISFLKTPNKILALIEIPEYKQEIPPIKTQIVLALDSINDPGNMGTIIRIANWYGISVILCSDDCVDCYSPKVVQSAMGSMFRTNIIYSDLHKTLAEIKQKQQVTIYSAELTGQSIYDIKLNNTGVVLIGSEAYGVSQSISLLADHKIKIPPYPVHNKNMESLNAAIATGIICAEFRRTAPQKNI